MNTLLIRSARLKIRNLKESDLDAFYQYRCNPEVTKYQRFEPFSKEQAHTFIGEQKNKLFGTPGEWVQYGIEHIGCKKLIGDCAIRLQLSDPANAEIGVTISNFYQRQGYAKETMIGILDFLLLQKGIARIVETVDAENIASIALLKSLFFLRVDHFVENIFFKGKWISECQFIMLNNKWKKLNLSEQPYD
jgi:ribosomal-protein-alanine N-acetyltransferase